MTALLRHLYELVGEQAVLLPLPKGKKGPIADGWQNTTFEQTQEPAYQRNLENACKRGGNIGALLGPASSNLCAIDIDTDDEIEAFLKLNPKLASSLRSRGANGCQIWTRIIGKYPVCRTNSKLKVPGTDNKSVAEWRGGGGHQSVIHGKHPDDGVFYRFMVEAPAVEIAFDEIKWPEHWGVSFNGSEPPPAAGEGEPEPEQCPDVELTPELKTRIERYLAKVPPAIEGEHGSDVTYRVAAVLVWDFALSFGDAKPFMRSYSKRCRPPWSEKEIDKKLKDARDPKRHKGRKPRGHLLGAAAESPPPNPRLFADLRSLWKSGLKPEVPTIARVNEELALFYAGRINEMHAEPGVGKTNLAMIAVILELNEGKDVIYLDPEDTPVGFLNRLVGLGFELTDENIARIHYIHDPSQDDIVEAIKFAESNCERISLVIYDGLAEGMAGEDLDEDKALDTLKFLRKRLRPFAEMDAAVVILDHVTKGNTGRFSRGSGAKIGHYDGVTYSLRLVAPYSPLVAGRIELKVAKDRNGGIGPANFIVCEIMFSPNGDGTTSFEFITPPDTAMHSPVLLKKISDWLQRHPDSSKRAIREAMDSKNEAVDNALDYLIKNGFVAVAKAETRGQADKYRIIRAYERAS